MTVMCATGRRGRTRYTTLLTLLGASIALGAARAAANPDVEAHYMLDPQGRYASLYDPETVDTIVGEVLRIERVVEGVIPRRGVAEGVQLVVITRREIVCVYVGPLWYVAAQPVVIVAGDRVAVRGSRVLVDGRSVVIADHLRTDAGTLVLRAPNGVPVWNVWRMP
jgi:hypothetical protein